MWCVFFHPVQSAIVAAMIMDQKIGYTALHLYICVYQWKINFTVLIAILDGKQANWNGVREEYTHFIDN